MALHIASDHVDQLADELARPTGESQETAVEQALGVRLTRVRESRGAEAERSEPLGESVDRCREANLAAGSMPMTKAEHDALWEA